MFLHLYCGCDLDGFDGCGVPVADYIARRRELLGDKVAEDDARRYLRALRAVMRHPWFETRRDGPPTVHLDPAHGDVFYAFPTRSVGDMLFILSPHEIPALKRWALSPKLYHDYRMVEA